MTLRMEPLATATSDAVLVGDPRRAFALAQAFTTNPRMTHVARGLWGYLGRFGNGALTVQSTGAGGGAAATIVSEMAEQGFRRMIRMGTCEALDPDFETGTVVVVRSASGQDGASRSLASKAAGDPAILVAPDPDLTRAFSPAGRAVEVTSRDLPGRIDPGPVPDSPLRDLQTAAFLSAALDSGVEAAALLVVTEGPDGTRLGEAGIEQAFSGLGGLLGEALGEQPENPKSKVEG